MYVANINFMLLDDLAKLQFPPYRLKTTEMPDPNLSTIIKSRSYPHLSNIIEKPETIQPVLGNENNELYMARQYLRTGQNELAIQSLKNFLMQYPDSTQADEAQYLLGKSLYETRKYSSALRSFDKLLDNHPNSSRRSDTLLKIGFIYADINNYRKAKQVLKYVANKFPGTNEAQQARMKLKQLGAR